MPQLSQRRRLDPTGESISLRCRAAWLCAATRPVRLESLAFWRAVRRASRVRAVSPRRLLGRACGLIGCAGSFVSGLVGLRRDVSLRLIAEL